MLRRDILKYLSSGTAFLLSGLLKPLTALANWNEQAFAATDLQAALAAYFPDQKIIETDQIKIGVQPVIEDGAVVPLKIQTALTDLQSITIFVDKNPNPLIASFDLSPACIGFISTRIKVQDPSDIIVAVKTDMAVFMSRTFVEVHEGGCG